MEESHSFLLKVKVWNDSQDCLKFTDDLVRLVIEWYDLFTDSMYSNIDYYGQKLHHIEGNRFMMTYKGCKDPVFEEFMADPDDDGNYPLIINGVYHLVAGKVVKTFEEDPKDES